MSMLIFINILLGRQPPELNFEALTPGFSEQFIISKERMGEQDFWQKCSSTGVRIKGNAILAVFAVIWLKSCKKMPNGTQTEKEHGIRKIPAGNELRQSHPSFLQLPLLQLCPEITQCKCFPSFMEYREEPTLGSKPNTYFLMVFLVFYNNSRDFSTDAAHGKWCTYIEFKQVTCLVFYHWWQGRYVCSETLLPLCCSQFAFWCVCRCQGAQRNQ